MVYTRKHVHRFRSDNIEWVEKKDKVYGRPVFENIIVELGGHRTSEESTHGASYTFKEYILGPVKFSHNTLATSYGDQVIPLGQEIYAEGPELSDLIRKIEAEFGKLRTNILK